MDITKQSTWAENSEHANGSGHVHLFYLWNKFHLTQKQDNNWFKYSRCTQFMGMLPKFDVKGALQALEKQYGTD